MSGFKQFTDDDTLTASDLNNRAASHEMVNSLVLGGGVVEGMGLTYTGLDLTIGEGKLLAKVGVSIGPITITVPPSVNRYVWIDSDGATVLTATTASPGAAYRCVGYFESGVSAITLVSETGKQKPFALYSGDREADMLGGVNLDGATDTVSMKKLMGNGTALALGYSSISGAKSDADYTLLASEYECQVIRLGWTGWTTGRNVIVPSSIGAVWDLINATGQAATIKASSGTGVAIASGKAARVLFDGTNVVRLTPDA